jgi:dolichyl-phosphate-mannose-protein mannosyltransferase
MSVLGFVKMQIRTWTDQQSVGGPHPYMSSWTGWALLKRPIWYAFEQEGTDPVWIKGILLLGNPLIMWAGILAVGICTFDWIKTRHRASFLITYLYLALYLCWALIPRAVSFYYYYYPAGMILGLALSRMFELVEGSTKIPRWIFLICAFSLFVYFLPILSGWRIPLTSLYRYLWFASWV